MLYTPDFLLLKAVVLKPRQQQLSIGALCFWHSAVTAISQVLFKERSDMLLDHPFKQSADSFVCDLWSDNVVACLYGLKNLEQIKGFGH